jgi:hypothetical protein
MLSKSFEPFRENRNCVFPGPYEGLLFSKLKFLYYWFQMFSVVIMDVNSILALLYCVVAGNVADVSEVHVSIVMAKVCRLVDFFSYFPGTGLRKIKLLVPTRNKFPPTVQELVRCKNVRTYTHIYIHVYIYTHITYIHTCTYVHTHYIHTYIHRAGIAQSV